MSRLTSSVALALVVAVVAALDPDVGKGMVDICIARGYTSIESHYVTTADGYILGLFRIPHGLPGTPGASTASGKPVVHLQHGLLDSSYTWVNNFENQSLAFILADAGYDVWMGNSRGNVYSTNHQTLSPDSTAFWDFTWDEMAKFDFPAMINYALNETGQSTLTYIGHSQGTIQAFSGLSINPVISSKVNLFVALAPVAYVNNQKSLLLTLMADLDVVALFQLFGDKSFLPDMTILQQLAPDLCSLLPSGCNIFLELLCGPSNNLNDTRIEVYTSETPAGTSVKNMAHWSQGVTTDAFQMFDYGCGPLDCQNLDHYGQKTPPLYHLANITTPTALFFGKDDYLGDPTDVQRILEETKPGVVVYSAMQNNFAHLDYTWGVDAHQYVYAGVVNIMQHYNPLPSHAQ